MTLRGLFWLSYLSFVFGLLAFAVADTPGIAAISACIATFGFLIAAAVLIAFAYASQQDA